MQHISVPKIKAQFRNCFNMTPKLHFEAENTNDYCVFVVTPNSSRPWLGLLIVFAWTPFNWEGRRAEGGRSDLAKATKQVDSS